ncbi:MAG: DUF6152 family protein [Micropepsaceae bacterium]
MSVKTLPVAGLALAGLAALGLAIPALAHHSHANYEPSDAIEITGTVVDYQWINPHTWIYITVMGDDGEMQEWALESGSTGQLTRRGWGADSMLPGDTISALIRPLKDGSYGGVLGTIILSDGTALCDPFGGGVPPDTRCREVE